MHGTLWRAVWHTAFPPIIFFMLIPHNDEHLFHFSHYFLFFSASHLFASTSSFLLEHNSVANCLKTNSVQGLSYHCSQKVVPPLQVSFQQKDLACYSQAQLTPKGNGEEAVSPTDPFFFIEQATRRLWKPHHRFLTTLMQHAEGLCLPLVQETWFHLCAW